MTYQHSIGKIAPRRRNDGKQRRKLSVSTYQLKVWVKMFSLSKAHLILITLIILVTSIELNTQILLRTSLQALYVDILKELPEKERPFKEAKRGTKP